MRVIVRGIDWSVDHHRLSEELVHYCVHVHRMRADTLLTLCDGEGREASGVLRLVNGTWEIEQTSAVVTSHNISPITLFCGLPKGDKLDRITRQASELGITEIVMLKMDRNVVQLDDKKAAKRRARLERVATEAARQSERSQVLIIKGPLTFDEGVQLATKLDSSFYFHPAEAQKLPDLDVSNSCGLFVGPEGGFSDKECLEMQHAGITGVHLGRTILRTETASVACIVATLSRMGQI